LVLNDSYVQDVNTALSLPQLMYPMEHWFYYSP